MANKAKAQNPILLYDGVCGLCSRLVQFTLRRDQRGVFRFAPLQSPFARELLRKHGKNADELDSLYIVLDPGTQHERLLLRSRAALHLLRTIGGAWKLLLIFGVLPTRVLDFFYGVVAKRRYKIFGRHDSCQLPDPAWQDRFIADG